MSGPLILAIDQGTTSTRAVVYDGSGVRIASAAREFPQHFPRPGWVEHDPDEIWASVAHVVGRALAEAGGGPPAAVGITNQRETVILWDRATGKPFGRALVWQDRRTTEYCRQRQADEPWISARTGLVFDPYFSASKIAWALDNVPGCRDAAEQGRLLCGTVDSFLVWRLTGGRVHATDVTNASRTLLLDLETGRWDDELCQYFGVPKAALPEVRPSAAEFGRTSGLDFLPDGVPISGVAGDQQAALFGLGGVADGDAKCTYGTGAFLLRHTGTHAVRSRHRLLSTAAATTGPQVQYALEGSVFIAGAAVQWLRDGLGIVPDAAATEELAAKSDPEQPLVFVPALVGMGAPHWAPETRGVLFGITRGTSAADLARATLEGVACQVADLFAAACADAGADPEPMRVDGGMSRNGWFLQEQADLLGVPVLQSAEPESTALGAALLAGLGAGVCSDLESVRRLARPARRFEPRSDEAERRRRLERWHRAVRAVIAYYRGADA